MDRLPPEILSGVLWYLPARDLLSVSKISAQFPAAAYHLMLKSIQSHLEPILPSNDLINKPLDECLRLAKALTITDLLKNVTSVPELYLALEVTRERWWNEPCQIRLLTRQPRLKRQAPYLTVITIDKFGGTIVTGDSAGKIALWSFENDDELWSCSIEGHVCAIGVGDTMMMVGNSDVSAGSASSRIRLF